MADDIATQKFEGWGKGSLSCSNKYSILEYIPLLDLISILVSESCEIGSRSPGFCTSFRWEGPGKTA